MQIFHPYIRNMASGRLASLCGYIPKLRTKDNGFEPGRPFLHLILNFSTSFFAKDFYAGHSLNFSQSFYVIGVFFTNYYSLRKKRINASFQRGLFGIFEKGS